jgi:uncharacterized membrane protein YozB (DUF420 family)
MATTLTHAALPDAERRFYCGMALGMALVVLAGFSSSFYLPGIIVFPRPTPSFTPLMVVHGIVFTAWMLLLIAQTQFIAAGNRALHMRLGTAGYALALVMLVLMFLVAGGLIPRDSRPPFVTAQAWSALPYFGIPQFALFIGLGWRYRRQPALHKRFMLLAALQMMEPAIGRLPLGPPGMGSQVLASVLTWLTILPLVIWDWRSLGRVHAVTLLGAIVTGGALLLRYAVWQTEGWRQLANILSSWA